MSLPKPSAKIWIDYDKKKVMLSAPYSQHFNQLVRNLPRFFNKETKVWEFEIEFVDQVVAMAFRAWTNVIRPPFLLMEIFEYLTEDDLKDMYGNLTKRHRTDEDKTLLDLLNKFFGDYIDLTEMMRKKKRMIRLEGTNTEPLGDNIDFNELSNRIREIRPPVRGRPGYTREEPDQNYARQEQIESELDTLIRRIEETETESVRALPPPRERAPSPVALPPTPRRQIDPFIQQLEEAFLDNDDEEVDR